MPHLIKNKNGKVVKVLRNPAEKASKYATELSTGLVVNRMGNGFAEDLYGDKIPLTEEQAAYRSGYLQARKDSADAYKHNQKKGK